MTQPFVAQSVSATLQAYGAPSMKERGWVVPNLMRAEWEGVQVGPSHPNGGVVAIPTFRDFRGTGEWQGGTPPRHSSRRKSASPRPAFHVKHRARGGMARWHSAESSGDERRTPFSLRSEGTAACALLLATARPRRIDTSSAALQVPTAGSGRQLRLVISFPRA